MHGSIIQWPPALCQLYARGFPASPLSQCGRERTREISLRKISGMDLGGFTKIERIPDRGGTRLSRGQGGTVLTDSVIPRRPDLQILYRLRVEMVGEECMVPRIRGEKREGHMVACFLL